MNNTYDEIGDNEDIGLTRDDDRAAPSAAVEVVVDAGHRSIHGDDAVAADNRMRPAVADVTERDNRELHTDGAAACDWPPCGRGRTSLTKDDSGGGALKSKTQAIISWLDHAYHRRKDNGGGCDQGDRSSSSEESEGSDGGPQYRKLGTSGGSRSEDDESSTSPRCSYSGRSVSDSGSGNENSKKRMRSLGYPVHDRDSEAGCSSGVAGRLSDDPWDGVSSATGRERLIGGSFDDGDVASLSPSSLRDRWPYAELSEPAAETEGVCWACSFAATIGILGSRESSATLDEKLPAEPPLPPIDAGGVGYERLRHSTTDDSSSYGDAEDAKPESDGGPPQPDPQRSQGARRRAHRRFGHDSRWARLGEPSPADQSPELQLGSDAYAR